MTVKIHYRITQDRAGIPQDFAGARHFVVREDETIEDTAKHQLAADYQDLVTFHRGIPMGFSCIFATAKNIAQRNIFTDFFTATICYRRLRKYDRLKRSGNP